MKRPRPHIPLEIRCRVARLQLALSGDAGVCKAVELLSLSQQLAFMLSILKDRLGGELELDHNPALILRKFSERTGKYTPDANDPRHLVYRPKAEHQQKTTGRKPGAARTITTKGSDIWLKTKFARLERRKADTSDIPETKKSWFKKAKVKIPSRPFPKKGTRRGRITG